MLLQRQLCAPLCIETLKDSIIIYMVNKSKQPKRMGQYANLGRVKRSKAKTRHKHSKYPKPIAWFVSLSWPKRIMFFAGLGFVLLVLIALVTYMIYANDIKDSERLMNRNNTGIVVKDINGETFYSIGRAEHREIVKLADISKEMKEALIASEDKDFYKHGGFNILSIARAAVTRVGGGSTITQQLAKNTLLTDQQTFMRKWQELAMSIAIEQTYSKDQILEMYINSVYYGENSFGISDAAKTYFGKLPKDLTLAESSMLVGLLPAPSAYSPISGNKEYAQERQNTVLTRMVSNGFITNEQKTVAQAEVLVYAEQKNPLGTDAPHFAQSVLNQLISKYGEETALRSGLQVTTTLDLAVQRTMRESVANNMANIQRNGGSNAAAIVIDPKTGEIRAYVGSADWDNEQWGKVDMVTTKRQPGSSYKSIYYAAALADGDITTASMWEDELTDFGGGYTPYNADRRWHGNVSTRNSIAMSLNIPSVKIMQQYGIGKSIEASKSLGIDTLDSAGNYGLSLALGSAEIPLIQMTNAYAAFANQGQQFKPIYIKSINDKFNKSIFATNEKPNQAISKEGAYLISDILSDNSARASIFGNSLTVAGHTVAVKTGTTNDNRDAWTIGYSPDYAIGVWVGNNNNTAMGNGGVGMAGPIWRSAMSGVLSGKADAKFVRPSSIVERSICKNDGGLALKAGSNTRSEIFMAGALPSKTCNSEPVMVTVCNLSSNKVESIDEADFNETTYTKDTEKCKKTVQVCDTTTGKLVVITNDEYEDDNGRYSQNTNNCQKKSEVNSSLVSVCDMFAAPPVVTSITMQQYAADTQNRYTTNLAQCQ